MFFSNRVLYFSPVLLSHIKKKCTGIKVVKNRFWDFSGNIWGPLGSKKCCLQNECPNVYLYATLEEKILGRFQPNYRFTGRVIETF